jgi:hypothetical protein
MNPMSIWASFSNLGLYESDVELERMGCTCCKLGEEDVAVGGDGANAEIGAGSSNSLVNMLIGQIQDFDNFAGVDSSLSASRRELLPSVFLNFGSTLKSTSVFSHQCGLVRKQHGFALGKVLVGSAASRYALSLSCKAKKIKKSVDKVEYMNGDGDANLEDELLLNGFGFEGDDLPLPYLASWLFPSSRGVNGNIGGIDGGAQYGSGLESDFPGVSHEEVSHTMRNLAMSFSASSELLAEQSSAMASSSFTSSLTSTLPATESPSSLSPSTDQIPNRHHLPPSVNSATLPSSGVVVDPTLDSDFQLQSLGTGMAKMGVPLPWRKLYLHISRRFLFDLQRMRTLWRNLTSAELQIMLDDLLFAFMSVMEAHDAESASKSLASTRSNSSASLQSDAYFEAVNDERASSVNPDHRPSFVDDSDFVQNATERNDQCDSYGRLTELNQRQVTNCDTTRDDKDISVPTIVQSMARSTGVVSNKIQAPSSSTTLPLTLSLSSSSSAGSSAKTFSASPTTSYSPSSLSEAHMSSSGSIPPSSRSFSLNQSGRPSNSGASNNESSSNSTSRSSRNANELWTDPTCWTQRGGLYVTVKDLVLRRYMSRRTAVQPQQQQQQNQGHNLSVWPTPASANYTSHFARSVSSFMMNQHMRELLFLYDGRFGRSARPSSMPSTVADIAVSAQASFTAFSALSSASTNRPTPISNSVLTAASEAQSTYSNMTNTTIRAFTLLAVSQHCPNLFCLDLSWSILEPDHFYPALYDYGCNLLDHPSLEDSDYQILTPHEALVSIARNCLHLESLDLRGCNWVTDDLLWDMVKGNADAGGRLRAVNVMECGGLSWWVAKLYFVKEPGELMELVGRCLDVGKRYGMREKK